MKNYSLGIDTSNYTTSVAVTDQSGLVICDKRIMLKVKDGERGLRQQEALFQHICNLPELLNDVLNDETRGRIAVVAVSSRPRPREDSYMPCFRAGQTAGTAVSAALGVPYREYSHQEGHIAAVDRSDDDKFLSYHLSGGTCELLNVRRLMTSAADKSYDIEIIGGSHDISIGQLLDRVGVAMGFRFPAGQKLDEIAMKALDDCEEKEKKDLLTGVKIRDLWFGLSGLETQVLRNLGKIRNAEQTEPSSGSLHQLKDVEQKMIYELFKRITALLIKETRAAREKTGVRKVIFAGGVSKSSFIRNELKNNLEDIDFGEYSEDNAVGVSLLGGRYLWR